MKMALTKNDMARVIVQALYGLPKLPAADNIHVKRRERKLTIAQLQRPYEQAVKILTASVAASSSETPSTYDHWEETANERAFGC
jgi:hypothetical protein